MAHGVGADPDRALPEPCELLGDHHLEEVGVTRLEPGRGASAGLGDIGGARTAAVTSAPLLPLARPHGDQMPGDLDVNGQAGGRSPGGEANRAGLPIGGPVPALGADVVAEDVEISYVFTGELVVSHEGAIPDLGVVHEPIMPLEERKARILGVLDDASIQIGLELMLAKEQHTGRFTRWVTEELPFGLDRAERLMMIARAFNDVDPSVKNMLPSAWTALYELAKVPPRALVRSIELGDVTPQMTVADARRYVAEQKGRPTPTAPPPMAEAHAIALMRYHPREMTEESIWKLIGWLQSGSGLAPFPTPSSPNAPTIQETDDEW